MKEREIQKKRARENGVGKSEIWNQKEKKDRGKYKESMKTTMMHY
jgi:hypothetical protein